MIHTGKITTKAVYHSIISPLMRTEKLVAVTVAFTYTVTDFIHKCIKNILKNKFGIMIGY